MAATITTLAERSYAYPNAIILHHQMSSRLMFANLNITEQKEMYEESQKWWARLAGPIAKKMGIVLFGVTSNAGLATRITAHLVRWHACTRQRRNR